MELIKTTPRGEMDVELHISYSQLNTFLTCSFKYAHRYVWGTPPESRPAALLLGLATHRAVETYYRQFQDAGEIIAAEQMATVFLESIQHELEASKVELIFKNGEDLESLRNQGVGLIRLFHAKVEPRRIVAVEYPFSVSVPDLDGAGSLPVKLVGVFDLIEADQDGTCIIGELKTAAQRFSNVRLEHDLQPTVYSYAAADMGLVRAPEDCLVRYDVLLKTKEPAFERYFITRNEADHRRMIHLVNEVLRAINQRIFYRNTGWQCGDCQYKKTCLS